MPAGSVTPGIRALMPGGTHICSQSDAPQLAGAWRSVDVGRDAFASTSVVKGRILGDAKRDHGGPFIASTELDSSGTTKRESSVVGDQLVPECERTTLCSEGHSGCRVSGKQSTRGEISLRIHLNILFKSHYVGHRRVH